MDDQTDDMKLKKQQRRFHALLVFVIFQSLVIIALFIAVVYKFIETGQQF